MAEASEKPTIYIIYYSMYGHILKLIEAAKKGVEAAGANVKVFQVPETLPEEVLTKMGAPPKADYPVVDRETWVEADGFIFAFPTRYGAMCAQFKSFFDGTGGHWQKGALVGKPAGIITSTGTMQGGQETTVLTSLPNLVHHGMVYVPMGYTIPTLFSLDKIHGGSPYGPTTFAGPDGSRQPSEEELEISTHYGTHFTKTAAALAAGRRLLAKDEKK